MLLLFIMDFDDDEEDYLDFELFEHICVTRTIRDRSNPLIDFSDEEFRVRFRLGKDTVIAILSEIDYWHDLIVSIWREKQFRVSTESTPHRTEVLCNFHISGR